VSDRSCRESKTCIECAIALRGKVGEYCRDDMVRAHCMLDTSTHSEYVILMTLFLRQWLHNGASLLSYIYIYTVIYIYIYIHICLFFEITVKSLQITEFL
jgi:hypothetical protein